MRDGIGSVLKAEFFHVIFFGVDGRNRHLLGIREFGDGSQMIAAMERFEISDIDTASTRDRPVRERDPVLPLTCSLFKSRRSQTLSGKSLGGADLEMEDQFFLNLLPEPGRQSFLSAFTNEANNFLNSDQTHLTVNFADLELEASRPALSGSSILRTTGDLTLSKHTSMESSDTDPSHSLECFASVTITAWQSVSQVSPSGLHLPSEHSSSQSHSSGKHKLCQRPPATVHGRNKMHGTQRDIEPTVLSDVPRMGRKEGPSPPDEDRLSAVSPYEERPAKIAECFIPRGETGAVAVSRVASVLAL
ncbi:unnamed protein product [Polarella glacialis]|uniref:Uncharacterized protein n=1 Tax=Polarella glacialis TaxID=89957 RepID=A0A813DE72_POLGL|nr:unnamed protein product [Polarella glacialis]